MLVQLPIGDWSGDGHGICRMISFDVEIEGVTDVRDAVRLLSDTLNKHEDFFGLLHPFDICSEYQDYYIEFGTEGAAEQFLQLMRKVMPIGYSYSDTCIEGNKFYFEVEELAQYTMAFLQQQIPDLKFVQVEIPQIRNNQFIGYGLLGH